MPKITLVEFNGTNHTIEAEPGGTCHVFVDPQWLAATGESDAMEEAMLAMRPDREQQSRLSCQIEVTDAMDGMVVRMPEFQM